jgi:hypothetical protein
VWDVATGRKLHTLKGHTSQISGLAFNPKDGRLASTDGHTVKVWDTVSGQELHTLSVPDLRRLYGSRVAFGLEHHHLAFSPDGLQLALARNTGSVFLWDARPLRAEVVVEREARGLVEFLFDQPLLKEEVLARLRAHPAISEPVRAQALAMAGWFEDRAVRFQEASWAVVSRPGAAAEQYRQALRWAEIACRLKPKPGEFPGGPGPGDMNLSTLGAAQYRVGRYKEAVETLSRGLVTAEGRAFLAMAHHRLGNKAKAQALLAPLRDGSGDRGGYGSSILIRSGGLLEEAEALIGPGDQATPKDK